MCDDEPRCQQHVLRRCDATPAARERTTHESHSNAPRQVASFSALGGRERVGVGPCMSCCTAATRTAFGLLRRGSKLSLSHTGSSGSSRLPAVARRGRTSRVPAAFRNAPAFTSRGGLVSLHRRHAGECPARQFAPCVTAPIIISLPETPAEFGPPEFAPNPPASTPTHRADSARFPSHPQRSSRAPAETTRSRAPSRPSPPRRRRTRRSATPRPRRPGLRSRAAATDR